ncbi:alpha-amylase [Chimaeribacter arupi]|uniref:alpha-amylase n=1 Tax=Chimaeribacter arupi TaxID=2060066 RepID=UPI000C797825|nr:alpha-amylase [Chimaeribacter arupi]PLR48293.1 alpha-amylase [Chimaeribacter arupi]
MKNPVILQFFHWYYPEGGKLWAEVEQQAAYVGELGISHAWLPPAYKGSEGGQSVGYDIYDLFDLGEFDQKGSVATKYGDKAGLVRAAQALNRAGVGVMMDVVVNHKMGADEKEAVKVNRVDESNRTDIADEVVECEAWTRFTFPGRAGKYSQFIWDYTCFSGVDCIDNPQEQGIFKIINDYTAEGWNVEVDAELGNFDYLMGANIDFRNHAVRGELEYWIRWLLEQVPCAGFRLDAVKHIPAWFYRDWLAYVQSLRDEPFLVVAEYWSADLEVLKQYLDQVEGRTMLFDVPLYMNFHHASQHGEDFDLRTLYDNTLVADDPFHAVTLVGNHDTQPLQALEAPVETWFKPLAYALVLLREQGVPTVFYPDLFGVTYEDQGQDGNEHRIDLPAVAELPALLKARQRFAHGIQTDYLDHASCIAFTRSGTDDLPGCVVVLSNGAEGEKSVALGVGLANKQWRDYLGKREERITTDEEGNGVFTCNGGSVSVWVLEECMEN